MQDAVALLPLADRVRRARRCAWSAPRCSGSESRQHLDTQCSILVTVAACPRGTALHRAARRLQALVGQRVEAESPHPRAQAERIAERIDGTRARVGDARTARTCCLRFEGGVVLRSHLRMTGRWTLRPRGERAQRQAVARAARRAGGGRALERPRARAAHARARRGSARTSSSGRRASTRCSSGCARRDTTRWFGEALLDQSLVAGIGNMWLAEALWEARALAVAPAARRSATTSGGARSRRRRELMRASVDRGREAAAPGLPPRRAAVPALPDARSARGGRATTTAWRTGARAARQETIRRGCVV